MAAKAMKNLFFRTNNEWGGILRVEGTNSFEITAGLFQGHMLRNDINDIDSASHFTESGIRKHRTSLRYKNWMLREPFGKNKPLEKIILNTELKSMD